MSQQSKLKIYEEEIWLWNKKPLKLKNMHINVLESCLKFIRQHSESYIYAGKKKYFYEKDMNYWIDAFETMIKYNGSLNTNVVIDHINQRRMRRSNNTVDKIYSMFKPHTIINQKLLKFNQNQTNKFNFK